MMTIHLHQPGFLLKSSFNYAIVLLTQIFYMCSLTMLVLNFFILSPNFFAKLSICHRQKIKLGFQKIAVANKIAFFMQIGIWSKRFSCYYLFIFIADRHKYFAKLRSTSCPAWSLTNGQKSRLKTLLNGCFLPILPDEKRREDGCLEKKRVKVGLTFFEDTLLIVLSY